MECSLTWRMLGVDAMLCSVTRQNLIREEFKKVPTTKAIVKEYDDETNRLLFWSTSQEQRNGLHQNVMEEAIQGNDDSQSSKARIIYGRMIWKSSIIRREEITWDAKCCGKTEGVHGNLYKFWGKMTQSSLWQKMWENTVCQIRRDGSKWARNTSQQEESQEVSTHDKGVCRTEEERSKVQVWYQCSTKCVWGIQTWQDQQQQHPTTSYGPMQFARRKQLRRWHPFQMDMLHEGECQTDNHIADVHVIRNDDITTGVSERSEVFEYVPGVPGNGWIRLTI